MLYATVLCIQRHKKFDSRKYFASSVAKVSIIEKQIRSNRHYSMNFRDGVENMDNNRNRDIFIDTVYIYVYSYF